jgi:hypothetical protein
LFTKLCPFLPCLYQLIVSNAKKIIKKVKQKRWWIRERFVWRGFQVLQSVTRLGFVPERLGQQQQQQLLHRLVLGSDQHTK